MDIKLVIDYIDNKPIVMTAPSPEFEKIDNFDLVFDNSRCHVTKENVYDYMDMIYCVMKWCQENLKIS